MFVVIRHIKVPDDKDYIRQYMPSVIHNKITLDCKTSTNIRLQLKPTKENFHYNNASIY